MIIRLDSDQIVLFWDMIRKAAIEANQIPEKHQQDYAINKLTRLLSGNSQAWVGYTIDDIKGKNIKCIILTSIIDEKNYGIRVLNIESIYGFRLITLDVVEKIYAGLEKFAKSTKCDVMSGDYSFSRVKEFLFHVGFEKHRTVCRKFLH